MPFDTISKPNRNQPIQPEQSAGMWAHHLEHQGGLRRHFGIISESAIAGLFLVALCLPVTNPYGVADAAKKSVKYKVPQRKQRIINPTGELSVLGITTLNMKPLSADVITMRTRIIPRVVKRGGFDKVYVAAGKKYGVPWQILAAVHYVETGQSGDTDATSSAGAKGPMQFMPGTFEAYKQDGDGNNSISILDAEDSIYSAAKMLSANGASKGNVRGALYRYNHSNAYVEKVLGYARELGY